MFRKMLIFYLKPLGENLPLQNKEPLEHFLQVFVHKVKMWGVFFIIKKFGAS